jgi:alpha-beta hydrolase superfamily lysophospholipase
MKATRFVLRTADAVPVIVHRWEPAGRVRGVVNIAHGLGEHAGRWAHVATALTDAGFAVFAEDHRGHGETAASPEELGFFAASRGWARVVDDLHRVTLRARSEHPDVPAFLFGHSVGSYLAQHHVFTFANELDGVVLTGSSGPIGVRPDILAILTRLERRRLGPRGRSTLLERRVLLQSYNRPFEPARTPYDFLTRDEEQVDRYIADPRCGFVPTTQCYLDVLSGIRAMFDVDRVRAGARPQMPIHIASGSEDPLGGRSGVASLLAHYERAGLTAVGHRLYEGARHEIHHELERDEVIADLARWFTDQATARASRAPS